MFQQERNQYSRRETRAFTIQLPPCVSHFGILQGLRTHIHSSIMRFFDQQNISSDMQHGFCKSRSCESQLILTIPDLAKGIDENSQIDAVLLDFSKAFDKVPHKRLASKLHHYGIRGRALSWIQSFLANRTQRVAVEGVMSDLAPVTSGVPQGTVLGPLLFLVYINDLPAQVKSKARLFADDCLLYRQICSSDDTAALQRDLDSLQGWERDWHMAFNPDKCEVIRITNPDKCEVIRITNQRCHSHRMRACHELLL